MAPTLTRRNPDEVFPLLTLIKNIPSMAWLLLKIFFFLFTFMAFIAAVVFAIISLIKLLWLYIPKLYERGREWYAARKERRAEAAAERAGQTEMEPLDGYKLPGGGDGDGNEGSVDGETLYDGGEEVKGVV